MKPAYSKKLVHQAVAQAVVREPNDLEWLFREGVLTVGAPYAVRLHTPDVVVTLLDQDKAADAFDLLATELGRLVGSVRTVTTGELQEHLLLALARVAAGQAQSVSVEELAELLGAGEPIVSMCEL